MLPRPSRPALPSAGLVTTALTVLTVLMMAVVPVASVASDEVDIDLALSEDVVVKNSDIDITITVRDGGTGEPIDGCSVVVHIQREAEDDDDDHMHGTPVEVPLDVPDPGVDIEVTPDPKSGWTLRVATTNWRWSPHNASLDNVWGEGHAHLFIDGEKVGRLYGEWHHIDGLDAGRHTVRVTLNTNDHQDLSVDGALVEDSTTLMQEGDGGHGHGMTMRYEVPDGEPVPEVDLTVVKDPRQGWNLRIATNEFRWAPENASTAPVLGEGHAHLYVDGHKVGRLYGEWFYLGSLAEGSHELRVTLNANNHSDYAWHGQVVEDLETVVVAPGEGSDAGGHGGGAVTVNATATGAPGRYGLSYRFEEAGDYTIEVHVSGAGRVEMAATFHVGVLGGDPAPVTVAWIVFYVVVTVGVILTAQFLYNRRKVQQLQELSDD